MKTGLVKLVLIWPLLAACGISNSDMPNRSAGISIPFSFTNNRLFHYTDAHIQLSELKHTEIIVEIFAIETEDARDPLPEHQFKLVINCTGCNKLLHQSHFTTFPLGSYGKFIYKLSEPDDLVADTSDLKLDIKMELIGQQAIFEYRIEGNILIRQ